MSTTVDEAPGTRPGSLAAAGVLDAATELRRTADRCEVLLLVRACEWADLHPPVGDEPSAFGEDMRLPAVAWDCTAELALAVGLSHEGGTRMLAEALELRHRLPRVWARLLADEVPAWRARRVAQATLRQPDDVAAFVDAAVAPVAGRVGVARLERLIDEALFRRDPELHEQQQLEALDARYARLEDRLTHGGVAAMEIRGDQKDLHDFDAMLALVAAELAALGCPEPLDVRRSMAVGVLADPRSALDLLEHSTTPGVARKQVTLYLHLSADALRGGETVGTCEGTARPVLEQQIRDWCGRGDTGLTVTPVIDLHDHVTTPAYAVPERLQAHVQLRDRSCVFPFCTRAARRCDHDHVTPHATGGATCSCNLAPLCRHHHRLKTHAGWTYAVVEPGCYLWASPHGRSYLRDDRGTQDVTPRGRPPDTGCQDRSSPARSARPIS